MVSLTSLDSEDKGGRGCGKLSVTYGFGPSSETRTQELKSCIRLDRPSSQPLIWPWSEGERRERKYSPGFTLADFRPRLAGDRSSSEVISFLLPDGTPTEARGLSVTFRVGVVLLLLLEAAGVAGELMLLRRFRLPSTKLSTVQVKPWSNQWSGTLTPKCWAEANLETTVLSSHLPEGQKVSLSGRISRSNLCRN